MSRRYSVAEARAQLPTLLDAVEHGEEVEITRRGAPVAVLLSRSEYERLKGTRHGFAHDFRSWRDSIDNADLDLPEDYFTNLRDRSTGRPVRL